jgi:hypothetical protein
MKHIRNALALLLLVAAFATGNQVVVQAAGLACPTFTFGLVLTSGQWQACFDAKQNALGYVPVNKAGDTMTGKLILPASTITNASTKVPQGTAPTVPGDGDVWMTTAGLFARTGGVTFGPLSSTPSYDKNGTRANPWHSVSGRATLSMGTVTVTLTGGGGLHKQRNVQLHGPGYERDRRRDLDHLHVGVVDRSEGVWIEHRFIRVLRELSGRPF